MSTNRAADPEALLRVRKDPDLIVAEYAKQFDKAGFEGRQEERQDGGATIIQARHALSGGGNFDAIAVIRSGEPTYMMIERCND